MAASTSDKITDTRNGARPTSTTVSSTRSIGGTTLSCASLTGWPTASKVHFVTYQIDTNNNPVANTQMDWYGIVSSNDIGSLTLVDGVSGNDIGNSVGDIVEMLPTAGWGQDLADALMASHDRDGSLSSDVVDSGQIVAGAVDLEHMSANSVDSAQYVDGSIDPEHLVASTGTSWAWQTWTPTFANFTKGSATITAKYIQIGKTVHFSLDITLSSSTMGSAMTFTLPVTAATRTINFPLSGQVVLLDSGTGSYNGYAVYSTSTTSTLLTWDGNNNGQTLAASTPFTWANNDQISINGTYEAA